MLASPWPEPVREAEKIRFVYGVQHLDRCTLDDFVFQRCDSERSLPRRDRTQALCRWAAGSCRNRLLIGLRRCLIPRLDQFPTSPVSSRTAGFPRSGWGQQLSPWSLPMMTSHVKRWLASFGDHQVCSKARRTRLHHQAPATVCRLVCVVRPLLPRAPLLRRHYPLSLLLRAHAHVLWPPCPFDLSLVGAGLRRLCHPRLVHWTVLALTVWLRPKVSCPVRRVLARCIRSFSSQATLAFATDGWLGALPVPPQATSRGPEISALQAFSSVTTLSFTCPPGRSHAVTRGEGFVARACLEFVSSSQVEPVIRLNRPITGAGSAPASHRVLLAAPVGLGDIHPTHRLRSVRSSLQPFGKVLRFLSSSSP